MKKAFFIVLSIFSLQFFAQGTRADKVPDKPNPYRWVQNLSASQPDFLTPDQVEDLHTRLEEFAANTSNQIVVLIIDDYNGLSGIEFATELGRKWGVGGEKNDNGIVVLIDPEGDEGDKDITIAVGYGLGGAIPDAATYEIQQDQMLPLLKEGRTYEAVDVCVTSLMAMAQGEYNEFSGKKKGLPQWAIIAIIIGIIVILRGLFGGGGGTFTGGGFIGGGFGGFRGFSGGGGFSSGGFGGGSFGGGGSSSSW